MNMPNPIPHVAPEVSEALWAAMSARQLAKESLDTVRANEEGEGYTATRHANDIGSSRSFLSRAR